MNRIDENLKKAMSWGKIKPFSVSGIKQKRRSVDIERKYSDNISAAGKYDAYLRDNTKYGDTWNELIEKHNIWEEEWDDSDLSLKKRDKLLSLALQFIKKYNIKDPDF